MKTVLYFQSAGKVSARQKLEGVYAYGRKHGRDVQTIESGASERKASELDEFWTPDGVIVECGSAKNHFDIRLFGKTPVVFLDRTAIANLCGYSSANALANFLRSSRHTP